jgi:hypothetical protein
MESQTGRHAGYQDYLRGSQSLFGSTGPVEECQRIKLHASDASSHDGLDKQKSMVVSLDWSSTQAKKGRKRKDQEKRKMPRKSKGKEKSTTHDTYALAGRLIHMMVHI